MARPGPEGKFSRTVLVTHYRKLLIFNKMVPDVAACAKGAFDVLTSLWEVKSILCIGEHCCVDLEH
jgi:hypothetical protein